ncbi:homeobox-leucine zipper protein HAT22-like [Trifolium pratense]|uniref:Homeobox-leucine zipper protein HAT22-like n=1 Tax=Trifolium pratense TaxID=57577 RepID=A0A2K3PME3_TRIPR|nr:homeobox-leucine zipper protein HAT22-like [Trifolium pratense]
MGLNNQDASNNPSLQLILGLALTLTKQDTPPSSNNVVTKPYSSSNNNNYETEPSLTLGLSTKSYYEEPLDFSTQTNSPHHSVVSASFSSGRVKRERDVSSELEMETTEIERVSSRISDEDEDGATAARKKLRLTKDQSAMLEESFKQHSTLNPKQKQALARELNLTPRQVEVWFQNRRARTKLKQTEVDCEFLKKCCETLTDENRRLQKEVQELKALKLAQPLYMPMPAATLSMCPSCERLGGGGGGGGVNGGSSNKNNFSMAPKPHFYNPFTNSSAAC